MSNSPEDAWSQIVKYSSVANGTALTLALSTIGKSPVVQLNAAIGKFPIWCFFIGLLSSGLHLIFSFYFQLELARTEGKRKLAEKEEQLNAMRSEALALGKINNDIPAALADLERVKALINKFDHKQGDKVLWGLRGIQELLLWTAYILFFVGAFSVVWSV